MTLLVDDRLAWQGQAGWHALIAGISAYPHLPGPNEPETPQSFGMRQLSSTALTAYKMYHWLVKRRDALTRPLITCRLLLSPTEEEMAAEPEMRGLASPCTLDNLLAELDAWRTDASSHRDGGTIFYFAGHGVQRSKNDAVMLLEGFGSGAGGTLRHAVDINNIFNGMAPSPARPDIAQTQVYFVDACRNLPSKFKNFEQMSTSDAFDVELGGRDDRCAPIFYAAVADSHAYALKGEQTVFSKALLDCLSRAAQEPLEEDEEGKIKWPVTIQSLNAGLTTLFAGMDSSQKGDQEFTLGGWVKDTILHLLDTPPPVDVELQLEPDEAATFARVRLTDAEDTTVWEIVPPLDPHPFKQQLPAGLYRLSASFEDGNPQQFASVARLQKVMPPHRVWKVKVKE